MSIDYPQVPLRQLSEAEYAKGLEQSDKHMAAAGLTRAEVHEVWLTTPGGVFARKHGLRLADPDYGTRDEPFIREVLAGPSVGDGRAVGLQAFLFGDTVDEFVDADPDVATPSERDGWFGSGTELRFRTWMKALQLDEGDDRDQPWHERQGLELEESVIWNGQRHSTDGIKVLHTLQYDHDQKGLTKWGTGSRRAARTIAAFWHWTAGWTARGGFKALSRRGFPTTLLFDNPSKTDGTCAVYQCFDPAIYAGTHGGTGPNKRSQVSGDLVTPAVAKYRDRLHKMTGHKPPLIRGARNEGDSWVIGYYLGQIEAILTLTTLFAKLAGMEPKIATGNRPGYPSFFPTQLCYPKGSVTHGKNGEWGTVLTHLEASRRGNSGPNGWGGPAGKWDCAGLYTVFAVACRRVPDLLLRAPWIRPNMDLDNPWWDRFEDTITSGRHAWDFPEIGITRT